ncbi:hypothetical protein H6A19_00055 [Clostridium saudiense]|uniref:Uncharacterized protein n=1 Tax=Clostridium saudiense TaxID=1414720 RepID=A0ABS2FCT4_9CLOT|nr:hypothetical protein [Clostridium saudiense]MBM6817743.1 hypothetical protein [Clostridium saudiense]
MEREKFKLDEIVRNKKELLKIIEEKEIQIEDQKLKLQLANEEIEKIKIELKELKKDISASIIDRVDNQLEEKKINAFRRINEKDNNISIELVEVEENKQIYGNDPIDEEKFLEESINKIMDEVENYKEKQNTNEIVAEELVVNSIEDKEKAEDKLILIENLKLVFIENNNYKSIEILNEILGNIKFIENNITDEEKILLLYLGYFYNKLEELLKKSEVINEFYYSDNNEIKLLIMLIEEKEYSIYQQVKETVLMKIIDNKKLFNGLDTILRGRIIDKIKNVSYKVFDGVYSIKDIKQGQDSITLKAWVKERDKENYKLVEGLYCKDTEKLYMLESSIYVLGLNIKYLIDDESETQNIQKTEEISDNKEEENYKVKNLKEKYEKNDEYYIDDEEEEDSNIWTRLKGKFRLKLKK